MFRDFNDFLARVKPQAWAWQNILGLTNGGTAGEVLTSNGVDALPTFKGGKTGNVPVGIIHLGALNMVAGTRFATGIGLAGEATEGDAQFRFPFPVTISELRARSNEALIAGESAVITVRKNGANGSVTVTLNDTNQTASDTTNSMKFGEGDLFSVGIVGTNLDTAEDITLTCVVSQMGTAIGAPVVPLNDSSTAAQFIGTGLALATLSQIEVAVSECLARAMVSGLAANFPWVNRNGSRVPGTARDGQANGLWSYFNANDLIAWETDAVGGDGPAAGFKEYDPDLYCPCPFFFSVSNYGADAVIYAGAYGTAGDTTTESEVQIPMPACVVRNLRVATNAEMAAGQVAVVTVRKNGTDGALTVSTADTGRVFADTSNSMTFAAGDLLSVSVDPTGAVTAKYFNITLEAFLT